jgi:hypothetical protein
MLLVKLSAMAERRSDFIFIFVVLVLALRLRGSVPANEACGSGSVAGLNTLTSSVARRLG